MFLRDMGAAVVGVDISVSLITAARRRFPDIEFHVGDAGNLSYAPASFDMVLFSFGSIDCLYPLKARTRCIGEVARVLRPGGIFILSFHNLLSLFFGWYKFMRPRKVLFRAKHILNGNAFRDEVYLPVLGDYAVMCYYARPGKFRTDVEQSGFEILGIYPNDPLLEFVRHHLGSNALTRVCDPWPYYVLRKSPSQ